MDPVDPLFVTGDPIPAVQRYALAHFEAKRFQRMADEARGEKSEAGPEARQAMREAGITAGQVLIVNLNEINRVAVGYTPDGHVWCSDVERLMSDDEEAA